MDIVATISTVLAIAATWPIGTLMFLILLAWAIAAVRRMNWRSKMEQEYGPDWEKIFYMQTGRWP